MSYKVLYRKYRPDDFNNIIGQDYTITMLKNSISSGKHAHAYIFTGPRGTGKTSSAKVFAKALNCENPIDGNPCNECFSCRSFKESPDIIEIDAASNNGVDEIRELINNIKLVPSNSKYKIYIIDEVHMLSDSAFNALLLTLEEPPEHVVFILATTDIQKVPITILSRCQRFDFKPISKNDLVDRLNYVCGEENIDIDMPAIEEIAEISAGGMRDALGMLDQLSASGVKITLEMVSNYFGSISSQKIDELLTTIEKNNSDKMLEILGNIKESGTNYAVFIEKLISSLRESAVEIKKGKSKHDFLFDEVYGLIFDLNDCLSSMNINVDPYVLIEIVLLKYISQDEKKYFSGNNEIEKEYKKKNREMTVDDIIKPKPLPKVNNSVVSESKKINLNIRINNCFVACSKDLKNSFSSSWIEFMNYLMTKNRNFVSLLADVEILAVSESYVLLSSKTDSVNEMINNVVFELEELYKNFSGNNYKIAALTQNIWQKEVEKYRFNLKNKIKYTYMEEDIQEESSNVVDSEESVSEDIEKLAQDIFGTFDVE